MNRSSCSLVVLDKPTLEGRVGGAHICVLFLALLRSRIFGGRELARNVGALFLAPFVGFRLGGTTGSVNVGAPFLEPRRFHLEKVRQEYQDEQV